MLFRSVGVAGHLKIGPKSIVAAKSGVITDLDGNNQYMGFPAIPAQEAKRQIVATKNLPKLSKRVTKIEKTGEKVEKGWRKGGEKLEKNWRTTGEKLEKNWRKTGETPENNWRKTGEKWRNQVR